MARKKIAAPENTAPASAPVAGLEPDAKAAERAAKIAAAEAAKAANKIPDDYDPELCWPPATPNPVILYSYIRNDACQADKKERRKYLQARHSVNYSAGRYTGARDVCDSPEGVRAWLVDQVGQRDADNNYEPLSFEIRPDTPRWRDVQSAIREAKPVVWANREFFRYNHTFQEHYVAVSEDDPTMVSYVESNSKGQRGQRTKVKPGRYLTKYFSDALTEKEIAMLAQWQVTGQRPNIYDDATAYPLAFATTPDAIVSVYMRGPTSCMDSRHFSDRSLNPVQIYGAGDLAVAYLYDANDPDRKPINRCLVWPEKKVMGRVYPTVQCRDGVDQDRFDSLQNRLRGMEYRSAYDDSSAFDGARLLKINYGTYGDVWLMPYIDIVQCVDDAGEHWIMKRRGNINATETSGRIRYYTTNGGHAVQGSVDEDEDEDTFHCGYCEEQFPCGEEHSVVTSVDSRGRASNSEYWCENCHGNHTFYCEGISGTVSDNVDSATVDGQTYTQAYVDYHAYYCDHNLEYTFEETSTVMVWAGGEAVPETWCDSAVEEHAERCCVSDVLWRTDDMNPCEVTGDLFAPGQGHEDYADRVRRDVDFEELAEWVADTNALTDAEIKAAEGQTALNLAA